MITKRIIPCLDVKDGRVVKGVNFLGLADVSSPVKLAEYYSRCGADELVFYDITAPGIEESPPRGPEIGISSVFHQYLISISSVFRRHPPEAQNRRCPPLGQRTGSRRMQCKG